MPASTSLKQQLWYYRRYCTYYAPLWPVWAKSCCMLCYRDYSCVSGLLMLELKSLSMKLMKLNMLQTNSYLLLFIFCTKRTALVIFVMMILCIVFSLCTTGVVRLHINNWLEVSFCLPHKIHRVGGKHIPPEALERSLKAIRWVTAFIQLI